MSSLGQASTHAPLTPTTPLGCGINRHYGRGRRGQSGICSFLQQGGLDLSRPHMTVPHTPQQ